MTYFFWKHNGEYTRVENESFTGIVKEIINAVLNGEAIDTLGVMDGDEIIDYTYDVFEDMWGEEK